HHHPRGAVIDHPYLYEVAARIGFLGHHREVFIPVRLLAHRSTAEPSRARCRVRNRVPERCDIHPPTSTALAATTSAPVTTERPGQAEEPLNGGRRRIFISPLARRLAREAGLPIDRLKGTGPGGRITRRDVEAALA